MLCCVGSLPRGTSHDVERMRAVVKGVAWCRLCMASTQVIAGLFFLLRREWYDVQLLNDLNDKHTDFSILNKGPLSHLSLPVSLHLAALCSCLPKCLLGTALGWAQCRGCCGPAAELASVLSSLGRRGCVGAEMGIS